MRTSYRPSFLSASNEDIGGKRYTVREIQRERKLEKRKEKIIRQFKEVDANLDKYITLEEWLSFLQKQVRVASEVGEWPALRYEGG